MRYEVAKVEAGAYANKDLYVAQDCPELPRSRFSPDAGTLGAFRVGDTHRMVLRLDPATGANWVDSFGQRDLPRYHAVRTDDDRL